MFNFIRIHMYIHTKLGKIILTKVTTTYIVRTVFNSVKKIGFDMIFRQIKGNTALKLYLSRLARLTVYEFVSLI